VCLKALLTWSGVLPAEAPPLVLTFSWHKNQAPSSSSNYKKSYAYNSAPK